jgi:LPS O-antigen subunit length determinant protein (WzzB/FepE family)
MGLDIPSDVLEFERKSRDVVVMTVLDKLLTKEYETAKIELKNTVPTIAVLDSAVVPQKRTKPKRTIIVLICTAVGFLGALFLSVILEALRAHRSDLPNSRLLHAGIRLSDRITR